MRSVYLLTAAVLALPFVFAAGQAPAAPPAAARAAAPPPMPVGMPPKPDPGKQPLPRALTKMAAPMLAERAQVMAAVKTEADAKARQAYVRETMLKLMGGLPGGADQPAGPLNARVVGAVEQQGFRVEKIIYDSLPGYHVTATLYLPTIGTGPYPAVIYSAGHGPFGKTEAYGTGANLAHNGIAVLAYDPLGAGERVQAIDPVTGRSYAGADEHSLANIPISLIGDSVSRYMLWDAMRGIDYLQTRREIAKDRIGSYGCSGGGTMSAYITSLDTRVKAGMVACFTTTYDALLNSIGPQDGEQVLFNFVKSGLDFPDFLDLTAPRAFAEVATTEDMFPFVGAKAAHEEAARFYGLMHAEDKLAFFTGPGGHGAIQPEQVQIFKFLMHNLAGNDAEPKLERYGFRAPIDLRDTTTGQVTTALPGRTIYQINAERAAKLMPKAVAVTSKAQLAALQDRLRREIPQVTGTLPPAAGAPTVTVKSAEDIDGVNVEHITFASRTGIELPGVLVRGKGTAARLIFTSDALDPAPAMLLKASGGQTVLLLNSLPWPPSVDEMKPLFGITLPMTSRAFLIGKTFVGMRADDVLAAVQYLATLGATSVAAEADGTAGVALLHAAVLEPRIASLRLTGMLSSYKSVLVATPNRLITETVVPGVLLHYDLDDLVLALGDRSVTLVDPVDGADHRLTQQEYEREFARPLAAAKLLHQKDAIRLLRSPQS